MHSNDFLLKDTLELELEIERHCVGLGLDTRDEYQVRQFVHEVLQNMEQLKLAASNRDTTARAKVELYGMTMMLHQANLKAYGADYMSHLAELEKQEPAWAALAKAIWSELENRNPDRM
jgi:hypothetical protein